ncbi:MAG: hypothetical protein M3Z54_07655 [Gemmatimonadota bacterium]|nr:hypothetical protein [Gemmatimonadota bacterium]
MRAVAELEAIVVEASREIQNGIDAAGAGYAKLLPAIHELIEAVYRDGGENAVHDLAIHAGPERIRTAIVGLMVASGMREVLITAGGRAGGDWKAEPDFAAHFEAVVSAGHLSSRGRDTPNPDPASGYVFPGIKVHKR